jgi:hypothetical protein
MGSDDDAERVLGHNGFAIEMGDLHLGSSDPADDEKADRRYR